MPRRKELQSVANSLSALLASRSNDFKGYWAIGQLCSISENEKLGIALETIGLLPINALRHNPENGTCGWYIWCGEVMSENSEFFKPLHVSHIKQYLPEVESYLALPPGFRILLTGTHEDVWFDPVILKT